MLMESRKMRCWGHVGSMGKYKIIVGKIERKSLLSGPKPRGEDNIRMVLKEIECVRNEFNWLMILELLLAFQGTLCFLELDV